MNRRRSSLTGRRARVQGPLVRASSTSSADDSPSLLLGDDALVSRVHLRGQAQRAPPMTHRRFSYGTTLSCPGSTRAGKLNEFRR